MTTMFDLPESEKARLHDQGRMLRVRAARARSSWTEYSERGLERRGRYLVSRETGELLELVGVAVFVNGDNGKVEAFNTHDVAGFYVDADGEPRFLRVPPSRPRTLIELEELERRREAKQEAERRTEERERERLEAERKIAVTFEALEGRKLPTLAGAARIVDEAHGRIVERDGRLELLVPASVSADPGPELCDAVRVLIAGRHVVLPAVASSSRKPLHERLPDVPVGPDGALIRP